MTLKEWMRGFMTLNAPFNQLRVCEAVTGKTINNISMGQEIYLPNEVLDRKVVSWAVLPRPYRFIVAIEPKIEKKQITNIDAIICEVESLLKESDHHATYAADGYDSGWYNGEGNAYETVLKILKEV